MTTSLPGLSARILRPWLATAMLVAMVGLGGAPSAQAGPPRAVPMPRDYGTFNPRESPMPLPRRRPRARPRREPRHQNRATPGRRSAPRPRARAVVHCSGSFYPMKRTLRLDLAAKTGKLQRTIEWYCGKHTPSGRIKSFGRFVRLYPSGKKIKGVYLYGKLQGAYNEYYPSGKRRLRSLWKEGVQHGWYHHYHANGKLKEEGRYWNGRRVGEVKTFHQNGRPKCTTPYHSGKAEGIARCYDQKTNLLSRTPMRNGKPHGIIRHYHPGGGLKVRVEQKYERGLAHGRHLELTPKGQQQLTGRYVKGQRAGEWLRWLPGRRCKTIHYRGGKKWSETKVQSAALCLLATRKDLKYAPSPKLTANFIRLVIRSCYAKARGPRATRRDKALEVQTIKVFTARQRGLDAQVSTQVTLAPPPRTQPRPRPRRTPRRRPSRPRPRMAPIGAQPGAETMVTTLGTRAAPIKRDRKIARTYAFERRHGLWFLKDCPWRPSPSKRTR